MANFNVHRDRDQPECLFIAQALADTLIDLEDALRCIPASVLIDTSLDPAYSSTVGKHVRHVVDHVRALRDCVRGATGGSARYEGRERGDVIEHDAEKAIAEIASLRAFVATLTASDCAQTIHIEQSVFRNMPPVMIPSSVKRELGFVFSHTIHHLATIRMMLVHAKCDGNLPSTFGYAPGTPLPPAVKEEKV